MAEMIAVPSEMLNLNLRIRMLQDLPTLPEMASHLKKTAGRQECGIRELQRAILLDPPLSAMILGEANRRKKPFDPPMKTISDALTSLPAEMVREFCTHRPKLSTFDPWNELGSDTGLLWKHAVSTGLLAKSLHMRKRMNSTKGPDPYITGLLHHIGWVVLDTVEPHLLREAVKTYGETGVWTIQQERELFGMDHAEAGAILLEAWGLPEEIVRVVRHHHEPGKAGSLSAHAALLQVASTLSPVAFPLDEPLHEVSPELPNRLQYHSGPKLIPELQNRYGRYILQASSGARMMLPWLWSNA